MPNHNFTAFPAAVSIAALSGIGFSKIIKRSNSFQLLVCQRAYPYKKKQKTQINLPPLSEKHLEIYTKELELLPLSPLNGMVPT